MWGLFLSSHKLLGTPSITDKSPNNWITCKMPIRNVGVSSISAAVGQASDKWACLMLVNLWRFTAGVSKSVSSTESAIHRESVSYLSVYVPGSGRYSFILPQTPHTISIMNLQVLSQSCTYSLWSGTQWQTYQLFPGNQSHNQRCGTLHG